jgi:toxin-antitoxin system PIN domain toxin
MKTLLDTNILVFAHNNDSPYHAKAKRIIADALDEKIAAYVTSQNLLEFYSVITSPRRVEHPLSSLAAADIVNSYWESRKIMKVLSSGRAMATAVGLVKKHNITKNGVFDCYLAATMKENGIGKIYTQNVKDFKRYSFLEVVNPF